jgi:HK97 family phage portal protein
MGFAARLRGLLRRDTGPPGPASDPLSWWGFNSGVGGPGLAGPVVTPSNATGLPVFAACVSLISQALATEKWQIERDLTDGGMVPVSSSANAMLTRMTYESKERFISSALISGNGYLVNVGGDLQALEWQNVAITFTGGSITYIYYQPLTGQHLTLEPEQMAILKYRSWGRLPWQGVPPAVVNATTCSIGMAGQHTSASAFRNGATPSGYLSTDGKIDVQKAASIQARWNENYSSALNAGKTAVLEQGLKYNLIERQNLVEIQMAELSKSNDADIARCFNVPLMVLGEITANRANSVEATRLFVSMCLETMAARVSDAVGLFVLTPAERSSGLRVVINLRRLTRGFGVELADSQSKEILGGIKSRNEARAEQGLAGSVDTQAFWQPVNVETIAQSEDRNARANAESAASIAAQEKPQAPLPQPANLAAEMPLFSDAFLDALEREVDGVEERQAEPVLPEAAE